MRPQRAEGRRQTEKERAPAFADDAVTWHDVECGGYEADLPLWEELAQASDEPVLEVGCGTGRVTLHLARRRHRVTGIDRDPRLLAALRRRAASEGLPVQAEHADVTAFRLPRAFGLIVAPMQLIQLLPAQEMRRRCLDAIAAHLGPGGLAALAIVEGADTGRTAPPPLPDVLERDRWVYSSLPLSVRQEGEAVLIERLRQTVAPDGRLREAYSTVRLAFLSAASLENEGRAAGLRLAGRRQVGSTDAHSGSTVVLMEA
jgi:SAM-dependent methyltransferase